jgi:hypothetical protein
VIPVPHSGVFWRLGRQTGESDRILDLGGTAIVLRGMDGAVSGQEANWSHTVRLQGRRVRGKGRLLVEKERRIWLVFGWTKVE